MSVWVDIKFAPKDGTTVDLWIEPVTEGFRKYGGRIADCYWSYTLNDKHERLLDGPFDGWCCDVGQPLQAASIHIPT